MAAALFWSSVSVFSQNSTPEDVQRADKQFDLYAYNLALRSYEQIQKRDPNNPYILGRLADCYFQLNRPEEAVTWYERAVARRSADPQILFNYGKALMYTGRYADAKVQFQRFAESNDFVGKHYADMCDYAQEMGRKEPLYAARAEPMNSAADDYGPAFLGNRLVFSSSRTDLTRRNNNKTTNDWAGSANNQLFITQRTGEGGMLEKPAFLRTDLQNAYNEGPVSFSADGRKVAFCRNNFINGTRQIADKGINMSLYTADVTDGNWVNIKAFPFNGSDYATGFPSLSANGKTLVFSTNQPGGLGGWDIYVSNLTDEGWSTPRNLGAPLNTRGNEVTPYYDGKDLYFSSDWHRGLGGLDVFRAKLGNETVSDIYHLGPGINSSRDDYGFVYNATQKTGYVSSNRKDGRGNVDIWQITKRFDDRVAETSTYPSASQEDRPAQYNTQAEQPARTPERPTSAATPTGATEVPRHIWVTDQNNRPLAFATLDLDNCNFGMSQTDQEGMFYFVAPQRNINCTIKVSKTGYRTAVIDMPEFGRENIHVSLSAERTPAPETYSTSSKSKWDYYTGSVIDAGNGKPIENATIQTDLDGSGPMTITTDKKGMYTLRLDIYGNYDIFYAKAGYLQTIVRTAPSLYSNDRKLPPVALERSNYSASTSVIEPVRPAASNNPERPAQYDNKNGKSPAKVKGVPGANEEPLNGYSIQLAASPVEMKDRELKKYEELARYGNLYSKSEGKFEKIRLGIYPVRSEAQVILEKVQENKAFKDVFVVEERGADESLILRGTAKTPQTADAMRPQQYSTSGKNTKSSGEVIRYAVQLGSFGNKRSVALNEFTSLSDLGNIYTKAENESVKVRMGVWAQHADAEKAQEKAVARGYKDAIVVTEKANDESLADFLIEGKTAPAPAQYNTDKTAKKKALPYFIRLMTTSNPSKFENETVDDLGDVHQRKGENGMTLILVGGYTDLETATEIQNVLRTRGFKECYIVKEEKGKLNRVK
jgi:cell division septation protein DedD